MPASPPATSVALASSAPLANAVRQDLAAWQSLFSLGRKPAEDQQLLARGLAHFCAARSDLAAALYSEKEGCGYTLQVAHGASDFPKNLSDPAAEPRWDRVALPGVILLFRGDPAAVALSDPELLALLSAARISTFKHQLQRQSFQARFRGVELEALYEVGLAIASTLNLDELGEQVLLRAVSLLDARRGALYLLEGERYRLYSAIAGDARIGFSLLPEQSLDQLTQGDGITHLSLIPDALHLLAVPVEIEGNPRGLLVVADKESRRGVGPFPATDRRTLSLFANQAAIALENAKLHKLALEKERLEREMELAAQIQRQILPKGMPRIADFEVIGWNRPARQVGGDYYDVRQLSEDRFCLAVGDVTGKGVPAALLVSTLHSALRLLLDRLSVGPPLFESLNRHIHEASSANKFVTLFLAELDVPAARLTYLNAGHNPGFVVRREGNVLPLPSCGLPIGLLLQGTYATASLDLAPGDLVCLYSDGITECASPGEEEFGGERLTELLLTQRSAPLPDLVRAIDEAVTRFGQGLPQGDDQTVVLLRRHS